MWPLKVKLNDWLDKLTPQEKRMLKQARHQQRLTFRREIETAGDGVLESAEEIVALYMHRERVWQIKYRIFLAVTAILLVVCGQIAGNSTLALNTFVAIGILAMEELSDWVQDWRASAAWER